MSARQNHDQRDLLELSSDNSCDEDDPPVEKTALRRMAIIDVCNVLYECARYTSAGIALKERCDAAGLIVMARQLLKAGFDFKMFVPVSYTNGQNRVYNAFVMEELQRFDYLTVINDGSHDDFFPLEMAKCNGGFVISNDKFRDHNGRAEVPEGLKKIINERNVHFVFRHIRPEALKGGLQALADPKTLGYLELDLTLKPSSIGAMFALTAQDPTYGMVYSQRVLRSERRALQMLERLDVMAEFLLQEICRIKGVKRSLAHLDIPDTAIVPERYERFWRLYELHQEKKQRNREAGGSSGFCDL